MSMDQPMHHHQPAPSGHWTSRAPAMLRDTFTGPAGEPCFTPTDRRWLWWLAGVLSIDATMAQQRQISADLRQYLHETCEHLFDVYDGDENIPAHRQCVWRCTVEPIGGDRR